MNPRLLPIVLAAAVGCASEQYREDADSLVEAPETFSQSGSGERIGFCSDFGDRELEQTLDRALDSNFDIRSSWARFEQSMALARQSKSSLYPTVTADLSAGRSRSQGFPEPQESNQFRASIGASYEIDLWGRLSNTRSAAAVDAQASRADFETMNISIANQIYAAWFDAGSAREQIALLDEQIDVSKSYLELTEFRLQQGASNALDVTQQRQQLESLKGQRALSVASEKLAKHQLAVLVAKSPNSDAPTGAMKLPELPTLPALGVPADLLDNRPDVRAELLRLDSADHRTKAAAAQLLPSIQLSANVFLQAANIGDLIDQIFWSVTGLISQTLFGGGRIRAEQAAAEAAARAQMYRFGQSYLNALKEVEDALVREAQQSMFIESLDKQISEAELGLELARDRYQSGVADYIRVLTSLQSVQQLQRNRIDARRTQLGHRLSLCRALGGQWVKERAIQEDSEQSAKRQE